MIATRLRDSPTLSAPGSANATARRAAGAPRHPVVAQQRFRQRGAVHEPPGQRRVDHDDRLLERHRPRDVDHRARRRT